MKHNNQLPNQHFRKHWQMRVKTWFDQAGRKKRRRMARLAKMAAVAPRPHESLRPAVRCQTIRYNMKVRAGRGFTLEEIKAAGLTAAYARSVGIAVDHRRRNKSQESLDLNAARLQSYLSKLVLLPKKGKAAKKGETEAKDLEAANIDADICLNQAFPVTRSAPVVEASKKITEADKKTEAYKTLHKNRINARYAGIREKRARLKAEEEAEKAASKK